MAVQYQPFRSSLPFAQGIERFGQAAVILEEQFCKFEFGFCLATLTMFFSELFLILQLVFHFSQFSLKFFGVLFWGTFFPIVSVHLGNSPFISAIVSSPFIVVWRIRGKSGKHPHFPRTTIVYTIKYVLARVNSTQKYTNINVYFCVHCA